MSKGRREKLLSFLASIREITENGTAFLPPDCPFVFEAIECTTSKEDLMLVLEATNENLFEEAGDAFLARARFLRCVSRFTLGELDHIRGAADPGSDLEAWAEQEVQILRMKRVKESLNTMAFQIPLAHPFLRAYKA